MPILREGDGSVVPSLAFSSGHPSLSSASFCFCCFCSSECPLHTFDFQCRGGSNGSGGSDIAVGDLVVLFVAFLSGIDCCLLFVVRLFLWLAGCLSGW